MDKKTPWNLQKFDYHEDYQPYGIKLKFLLI